MDGISNLIYVVCLIARGNKMKLYKKAIPYVLMGVASVHNFNSANAQSLDMVPLVSTSSPTNIIARMQMQIDMPYELINKNVQLSAKAKNLRTKYIGNVLNSRKKIASYRGTSQYTTVVSQELPGATVGRHCMYGQYTQLMRALAEIGDTLTIVPLQGSRDCVEFKSQMREKYSGAEYKDCILEGRVFPSDSAYNAALDRYLTRNGIGTKTDAAKRAEAIARFKRGNFSVESVNPGSIWIVPRYAGERTLFHAIMFLGRGKVVDGHFVSSNDGQYMYAGFNREQIGNVFEAYDMSHVFSADIERISATAFGKELAKLESMPNDKIIEYILQNINIRPEELRGMPRHVLVGMLHSAYFGKQNVRNMQVAPQIAPRNAIRAAMVKDWQRTI